MLISSFGFFCLSSSLLDGKKTVKSTDRPRIQADIWGGERDNNRDNQCSYSVGASGGEHRVPTPGIVTCNH